MLQTAENTEMEELRLEFPGLYTWQYGALRTWRRHERQGVIEAVTGAGKTRVGVAAAHEARRLGVKVMILVPNAELQGQWVGHIRRHLPEARVGRLGGTLKDSLTGTDVLIAIVNSASTRDTLRAHQQGLVIADECHRYAAMQFQSALQDNYQWRMGLTATYRRRGGNEPLDRYFGGVIYRIWYPEALAAGIISDFDLAFVGVRFSEAEQAQYDWLSKTISSDGRTLRDDLEERGIFDYELFHLEVARLADSRANNPINVVARRYQSAVADRQKLLANTSAKTDAVFRLAPAVEESSRSLIFGHSRRSAHVARDVMLQAGIPAESVMSGMLKADRVEAMEGFRSGRLKALAAPRVLDEGIDIPEADLAIITSATRTERQTIQRLGRVIRRKDDGTIGRLVYLFVIGTLEDPASQAEFLPSIIPHARRHRRFTLPGDGTALLNFLKPVEDSGLERRHTAAPERFQSGNGKQPEVGPERESFVLVVGDEQDAPEPRLDGPGASADPVKDYLKQIGKHQLLNSEQEVELAQWTEAGLYARHQMDAGNVESRRALRELNEVVREGEAAKKTLIVSNLRLVVSVAKRYTGRGLPFLDIIQEGNLGLYRAVQKFDFTQGLKFSTYATWWIRQAITRAMANQTRLIRLPVHVEEKIQRIQSARRQYEREASLHPKDLAFMAEVTADEIPDLTRLGALKFPSLEQEYWTSEGLEPLS